MNWSKVDPALASALDQGKSERFVVFVQLSECEEADVLTALGVEASGSGAIRTATVTADEVERLSDEPGVTSLRLSKPVGLAEPG